jgi:TolA-binding protein
VQVGGPLLPERVTLRAGQRLRARLASSELLIGDARVSDGEATPVHRAAVQPQGEARGDAPAPAPAAEPQPAPVPAAPAAMPAAPLVPSPPAPPAAAAAIAPAQEPAAAPARPASIARRAPPHVNQIPWAPRTWSSAITTGNAARVVAEAEAHGLEKALVEVDSTALMALSDASRYSGRPEVAVRALVAERQRFPDTTFAHAAAFLLGKLADDRGEVAAGLAWYRRYLSETPDGPYAAEALGRKMLAIERIAGRDAARSIASEYVQRFPNGTYMLQAHAILANPTP